MISFSVCEGLKNANNVFITGGCGLLGSALASEFHHEGYRVIVLDTESVLSEVVFDLPHESHPFDVTDTAEQKTSLNELEKKAGPIQNWINCAYPKNIKLFEKHA